MTVKSSSDNYIKQLAESIASLYSDKSTPLELIVEEEGIELFYDDYGDSFDGMTFFDNEFYMHLNETRGNKSNSPRGRFTLAHELGHYFIDNHRVGLVSGFLQPHGSITTKPERFDRIEREADYFAACLLMPENLFKKQFERQKFSFEIIQSLATTFNVSLTAAAFRFKDIGNHPVMLIYAVNNSIKWVFASDDFPYKYLSERRPLIPENTHMDKCFKKQSSGGITIDVWAIEWFNGVSQENLQRKFKEHCVVYNDKVLSVIW